MANQSDKRIAQENLKCLKNLKWGFIIVNVIYVCFRILYHYETFTSWIAVLYFVTSGISMFLWMKIISHGSPRFGPSGNVEWPGNDLNSRGLTEQIPLYALYKIWTLFIQPSMFLGDEGTAPQEQSKRQKKIEKKHSRR
ncbi:13647_t:CDS:2 [Cetraspora pellucida]|uniref:13647_t:CDS:1 n=1 Tax=Cetraspora pellucida TaxID=1433469 RepID=A0A9N9F6F1_9GLOM|nr:13647_t:CDS:2 [Cetraspora pellucida]